MHSAGVTVVFFEVLHVHMSKQTTRTTEEDEFGMRNRVVEGWEYVRDCSASVADDGEEAESDLSDKNGADGVESTTEERRCVMTGSSVREGLRAFSEST